MHLGIGGSYNFDDSYKLYGQFLLGEFVLREFIAGTGWWGNKYGIQLGIQTPEAFKISGLHLLLEGNLVRPYTYSHSNTLSNYGYEMQPLAHPLGANFIEGIVEAKYIRNRNILALSLFTQFLDLIQLVSILVRIFITTILPGHLNITYGCCRERDRIIRQ